MEELGDGVEAVPDGSVGLRRGGRGTREEEQVLVIVLEEAEAAAGDGEAGDDGAGPWSSRRNRAAVACSQGGR